MKSTFWYPGLFVLWFVFSMILISCKDKQCKPSPDVSGIQIEVQIDRLDRILHKIPTKDSLASVFNQYPEFALYFLHIEEYPHPGMLVNQLYDLMHSPGIDSLFLYVDEVFGDLGEIKIQFEDAFRLLKYYYPDFKPPRLQTVVTGISNDLFISDSLIIIGLDYYLGQNALYRPKDLPEYILKRYQKEYMVPQIMLMYTNYFNETNYADKTAMADMVFYGKAYYLARKILPCTPDSLLTGYTSKETGDIIKYEPVIWAGLLENELLFETSHYLKDKILSERPKTHEIGENCPGRIGRWVGWRIVEKYSQQYPQLTVPQIMENTDAQKIFNESKYKPIKY